ncbi:MAG TPA: enoyl-CoA hydratase [Pyrinomonadaceae bacterium]|nr:enoyl-CoA hydratase [Pyrinomonadaceae bacterium]
MSTTPKLLVTLEDRIKRITFNRPERRNSVDFEMFALLADAMREAAADDSRVVVLTGAGDSFCAGADLLAAGAGDISGFDVTAHLREHTTPAILAMRQLDKPVIARVHGHAVGIGFSYALACDIVVASEQSVFGMGFIKIGLMPDGGSTYTLPQRVGYHKAFELMTTGQQIDAREAHRLGLVNRLVASPEELDDAVNRLASGLARAPQPALAKIKRALNRTTQTDLADALEHEAQNQHDCFHSPDFLEGVAAFMQKRAPDFGRTPKQ